LIFFMQSCRLVRDANQSDEIRKPEVTGDHDVRLTARIDEPFFDRTISPATHRSGAGAVGETRSGRRRLAKDGLARLHAVTL
jgi:hypothetical protein